MFGSLPTGVKSKRPYQTLLFRHLDNDGRPYQGGGSEVHPGYKDPKDHYFMDFFWMPVVEPYSISEPLSTAGKINLNYAIEPFRHIKRSSGVRAVLGSEEMLTVPNTYSNAYKAGRGYGRGYDIYRHTGGTLRNLSLRSWINANETLRQFDEKFDEDGELFRAASELCELWMVPREMPGLNLGRPRLEHMERIWKPDGRRGMGLVGDNSRERPYVNTVPRFTTKSNVFQVHFRAQIVRQSLMDPQDPTNRRSDSDYALFDPAIDQVVGEYRGSTIIERFIDPEDRRIPDYGKLEKDDDLDTLPTLDHFYRFRVISNKRFAP